MRDKTALAFLVALGSGCTSPTGVNELPTSIELAAGNRVELVGQGITLQFDSVVTDSRCPLGVLCIVAGQAVLSFSLSGPNAPGQGPLLLASDRPDSSLGVVLSAEEVTPIPRQNQPPPDHRAYRVTLRIEPN